MNPRASMDPALEMMTLSRWDEALTWLKQQTDAIKVLDQIEILAAQPSRDFVRAAEDMAEELYSLGTEYTGELALCWLMLAASPREPQTFLRVMPKLQLALDGMARHQDKKTGDELRLRIACWWGAAMGDHKNSNCSIFEIANQRIEREPTPEQQFEYDILSDPDLEFPQAEKPSTPSIIVMRKAASTRLAAGHAKEFESIVDQHLPLVVARDIATARATLFAEYPHATAAIDLVLRDLREGAPARLNPVLLVGPPGNGKSRLARRLGSLLGLFVYRFDGGGSSDNIGFGGTPKGWGGTMPSVPARAVQQSRTANPIVFVDEIEKAASESGRNGRLWDAILPHLERETAARYRDVSLDAELDLSWISHIATANSWDALPGPLKDRYRIVNVPAPRLSDLPKLVRNIVQELATETGEEAFVYPIDDDELGIIAAAWPGTSYSIRKLQKMVIATLQARDAAATKH